MVDARNFDCPETEQRCLDTRCKIGSCQIEIEARERDKQLERERLEHLLKVARIVAEETAQRHHLPMTEANIKKLLSDPWVLEEAQRRIDFEGA